MSALVSLKLAWHSIFEISPAFSLSNKIEYTAASNFEGKDLPLIKERTALYLFFL